MRLKSVTLSTSTDKPLLDLANKFRTEFEGHFIVKDQNFVINYDDEKIYVTVLSNVYGILTMNSEVGVKNASCVRD